MIKLLRRVACFFGLSTKQKDNGVLEEIKRIEVISGSPSLDETQFVRIIDLNKQVQRKLEACSDALDVLVQKERMRTQERGT